MDRRFPPDRAATDRDRLGSGRDPGGGDGALPWADEPVLPSRAEVLAECRRALRRGRGPVLLTGEAGSGKSWLWRHLADTSPGLGRWLGVDAAPSDDGIALLRRALRGLGRADLPPGADPRAALADELAEQAEDGRRWVLVLDEAQNAHDAALEEFRLLSNRLGQPDGFAGLMLVGRTGLALRVRGRAWASLESRLASHVQLGPIDAEEAAALLGWGVPGRAWSRAQVEAMHARSLGNAARLIRLADRTASPVDPHPTPTPSPAPTPDWRPSPTPPAADRPATTRPASAMAPAPADDRLRPTRDEPPAPRLGEARPPLRFEEGLIEVGWDEVDEPSVEDSPMPAALADADRLDFGAGADDATRPGATASPAVPKTEAIDDPYAAIQARSEWSQAVEAAAQALDDELDAEGVGGESGDADGGLAARRPGQVRVEAGQEFAPYSRLFSQLNSASDAD